MTTQVAALNRARGQLGYRENPAGSNRTKFGDWYGMDGQPWCAMFVTWCAVHEGSSSFARGSRYAYVPYIEQDARAERYGLSVAGKANGRPGDVVTFDWEHDGLANHVGLVEENLGGGSYRTIEGNTSQSSDDNGGEVQRRTRSSSEVSLIVRWPNEQAPPPPQPEPVYWPLWRLKGAEDMPPDYLIRYPTNPEGTSAENYAVYPSGIVRRVAGAERAFLADQLGLDVIELTDETHRDRLAAVDAALRGK